MSTIITYISDDEASVKKAFNALMVRYANNTVQVLDLLKQNPFAVTNAEAWKAELKQDVEVMQVWETAKAYIVGELVKHNDIRYVVVQGHTSQLGWEPPNVPALFTARPIPNSGYPLWVQPLGAQDAYNIGDRVSHNNQNWESTSAANVWEPGVFGWVII